MEPRARVSVWPGRRCVPGIVAPDSWGARGAECLPRDVLRRSSPASSPCDGITARRCLCHGTGSGTTEARLPASSVPPAPHGGLGVLSRHLVNSGPDFRSRGTRTGRGLGPRQLQRPWAAAEGGHGRVLEQVAEGRLARRREAASATGAQLHRLVLVARDQAHRVLARPPRLGRRGDRRLGVDPRRVVEPGRGRLGHRQGFRRVGHGLAVLAQGREGQAPAQVGVGIRGSSWMAFSKSRRAERGASVTR